MDQLGGLAYAAKRHQLGDGFAMARKHDALAGSNPG